MSTRLSPDKICAAFSDTPEKLTVRQLESDTVLIEGSAEALEFLGNLLIAQARFAKDCGFQISPTGAGSALFSSEATVGVYIHRLPCLDHQAGK
jgi:hypothetical protein